MNKTELVSAIAEKTGLSKKDSEKALAAAVETVTEALKAGDKIQPQDRRAHPDRRFQAARLQGRQGSQGFRR